MKNLKDLVRIVTPNRLQKMQPMTTIAEDSKIKKLYNGLSKKEWENDEEAIKALYPNEALDEKTKNKYYKLKHDLKEKLIQIIPLVNFVENETWDHTVKLWECYTKYNTAILILRFTPLKAIAIELLEKVHTLALKIELTELVSESSYYLSKYYFEILTDQKKAKYYNQLANDYSLLRHIEIKGDARWFELLQQYVNKKSSNSEVPKLALKYKEEISAIPLHVVSQKHIYNIRMLEVIHYMCKYDYRNTILVCEQAIQFFESATYPSRPNLRMFYYQAIASHIYMREFEQGSAKVTSCLKMIGEGQRGWFKVKDLAFMLALYSHKYIEAYEVYLSVTQNEWFEQQPTQEKELWAVYDVYLTLFHQIGELAVQDFKLSPKSFGKLINQVPIMERDKKGLNFAIRILQFIYYLHTKKTDLYIDRCEAIKKYVQRYKDSSTQDRNLLMVNILDRIATLGFQQKAAQKDKLILANIENLKNTHYDITDANYDIEILPYQDIAVIMIGLLGKEYRDVILS